MLINSKVNVGKMDVCPLAVGDGLQTGPTAVQVSVAVLLGLRPEDSVSHYREPCSSIPALLCSQQPETGTSLSARQLKNG